MKNRFKLLMVLSLGIVLNACDKIEGPVKEDISVPAGERKVLVEDYTGHKCGNCPRASRALYDLKSVYGDRLVIMGIHAGGFATVFPPSAPFYTYDFRTQEGTELDTDFGISLAGNPNGMVNRRTVNGNIILGSTKWADEVATVLGSTASVPVKITIDNSYASASRELQTQVKTEILNDLTGSYKLCVFMIEDSIVNWQKDYDAVVEDDSAYVHREVLRGSMNGTYGESVSPLTTGNIITKNYSFTLDNGWNEQHFSIIAYLYNEATKEILQVEQEEVEP